MKLIQTPFITTTRQTTGNVSSLLLGYDKENEMHRKRQKGTSWLYFGKDREDTCFRRTLWGPGSLCTTTLGQTWQAIKWKKKKNRNPLVPTPPFQKTINLPPANGSFAPHWGGQSEDVKAVRPQPIGGSILMWPFFIRVPLHFSDPTYLWCVRGHLKERTLLNSASRAPSCAALQIWDYCGAPELMDTSEA